MLEQQQTAVDVDDHGLASLAELLAVMILARRLDRHPAEDPRASSRRSKCGFSHGSIFKAQPEDVNREAIWLYRITNWHWVGCLVSPFVRIYDDLAGARGSDGVLPDRRLGETFAPIYS